MASGRHSDGPIPRRAAERFLRTVPRDVRPFPDHPDPGVRRIRLREVYRATLGGIGHLLTTVLDDPAADRRDVVAFCAGLRTSLHPFLAENEHLARVLGEVVPPLLEELSEAAAGGEGDDGEDLYLLGFLQLALPLLPRGPRARSRRLLRLAGARLRRADPGVYVTPESPVLASLREHRRSPVGPRPDAAGPWDRWLFQVVEARFAHSLGLELDVEAFYARTADELLGIPFDHDHALELFNVLTHAIFGLGAYHAIPLAGHPIARRLADHGLRFLEWLDGHPWRDDVEILAESADAFFKATSRSWGSDPRFGAIVAAILDAQRSDGGWAPPPRRGDPEALYRCYHPSWVCVDALRPLRLDLLNPDNRALGLV